MNVNLTPNITGTKVNVTKGYSKADLDNSVATTKYYRDEAEVFKNTSSDNATTSITKANEASVSASNALTYKNEAQAIRDSIEDITATATTLTAGSSATASFDIVTNVLSLGIPQGIQGIQGIQGVNGDTGNGIASIVRTSGTGVSGTTDTYTIIFTDATTTTFNVYNGADGAEYDDTVLSGRVTALETAIGDINSALDTINGQVI